MDLLTPDNLFQVPDGAPPPGFGIMTGAFVVLFLLSVIVYWRRAKFAPDNPILRRFIRRVSKATMWTALIGLFFAVMRYIQFPYLDVPIWLWGDGLLIVIIAGYFVYERSERYPLAVWQLQQHHAERKYRPASRRASEPQRPRQQRPTNVRGKRRR